MSFFSPELDGLILKKEIYHAVRVSISHRGRVRLLSFLLLFFHSSVLLFSTFTGGDGESIRGPVPVFMVRHAKNEPFGFIANCFPPYIILFQN